MFQTSAPAYDTPYPVAYLIGGSSRVADLTTRRPASTTISDHFVDQALWITPIPRNILLIPENTLSGFWKFCDVAHRRMESVETVAVSDPRDGLVLTDGSFIETRRVSRVLFSDTVGLVDGTRSAALQ